MVKSRLRFPIQIVAILAAMSMVFASLLGFVPTTRQGMLCPTAPVRSVLEIKRDCCGRIVRIKAHAPRPGDRGFVQCRCAEKKAVGQTAVVASKVVLFLESKTAPIDTSSPHRETLLVSRFVSEVRSVPSVPDVPPPSV